MVAVTVSGLPGSGKTTAANLLARALGVPTVSSGQFFRDLAAEHGMSLAAFGRHCETHPEVDRALDARQVERLRQGGVVLEGRLAAWMARRHGVPAFTVWLEADERERARRIARREGGTVERRMRENRAREASEAKRYRAHYGIDLHDKAPYDLVVDSSAIPPEEVVARVLARLR